MLGELDTLLKINTALGIVPVLVFLNLTRLLARVKQMGEDVESLKRTRDVHIEQIKESKERHREAREEISKLRNTKYPPRERID